jgi:hypothetical protein
VTPGFVKLVLVIVGFDTPLDPVFFGVVCTNVDIGGVKLYEIEASSAETAVNLKPEASSVVTIKLLLPLPLPLLLLDFPRGYHAGIVGRKSSGTSVAPEVIVVDSAKKDDERSCCRANESRMDEMRDAADR